MPVIQLDNLGNGGIITDVPPYELPLNAFSAGSNVRLRDDGVQRTLGYKAVLGTPGAAPYYLMPWQTDSIYYWLYATAAKIYRFTTDASSAIDVTRTAGDYTGGSYPRWNGGMLGGVPIMNHSNMFAGDYPQSWDGSSDFQDLPNWPSSSPDWLCKVIRPFRNFLVALYMKEGTVVYPHRLRWSQPADPGTVPTAWEPAASNLAGSKTFSDSRGLLVDCLPMRDMNVVYKEDAVHLMQYVGGNFVFNFRQAFSEFGLLTQRAVKSFFGKHLVLSRGDIVLHDGQTAQSIVDKVNRREIFNSISEENYENSFLVAYPDRSEIWCCIPVNGSGVPTATVAYIWNWRENKWTRRDLPGVAHIALGVIDESGLGTTFNDLVDGAGGGTFDEWIGVFDQRVYNPSVLRLLGADTVNTRFLKFDDTNQQAAADFDSYVERTDLALGGLSSNGQATVDPHSIKFVRRIYPKITADPGASITIKIGGQDRPGGMVDWTSYTFDPNSETYISCAKQGKLLAYYVGNSSAHQWKLHSIGFDLDVIGWQ